jgi:hypothetical protein
MSDDQIPLFVEDYAEAIRATVQALGGFKRIGHELKPDLSVEAAGRWLADCCNPEKREKLSPSELAWIRRRARQESVHLLAAFEMQDAGYAAPQPVEPEDERAALMREFVRASKVFGDLLARMERRGVKVDPHG